jgi:preprotein translocase subunit SecD
MSKFKLFFTASLLVLSTFIIIKKDINLGLDLQGGMHLILQAKSPNDQPLTRESVLGSIEVIRNRIDSLGLTEPSIRIKGKDQISIELPGIKNPEEAKEMIGDTALLEFALAEWAPPGIENLTRENQEILIGKNGKLAFLDDTDSQNQPIRRPIILKEIALTGGDLNQASPGTDQFGKPIVNLDFNQEGSNKFYQATARSINKPLAILLDKRIISAPNVNEAISGGKAQISGSFTPTEVSNLVIKLNAGALPVPVEIISEKQIGPTLGRDSIEKSKLAFLIGMLLVALYMIFIYRGPGLLASISLITYIILAFSFFQLVGATLTLPGIAGFILTIGMAVDANVIIFERIKEELNDKLSLKASILNGFKHAYVTILDANITTLIAALVLFWLGTGTIKGFAITLSIGIIVSMFSAITITQALLLFISPLSKFKKG